VTEISDWSDLEIQLQETRESLNKIEHRLHQVRRDLREKQELEAQQEQMRSQIQEIADTHYHSSNNSRNSKIRRKPKSTNGRSQVHPLQESLHQELEEVNNRLEQIEAELESRLISWSSFQEIFWQVVRFVGIGIIIGVILRSCAG
jgi:tetrahydromethanopterin S-methyltransferase subunit G